MMVLVDTSVWSPALRRRPHNGEEGSAVQELGDLSREGKVVMIGPIRQELLTGIPVPAQFERLKEGLSAIEDLPLRREHYETAAEFSNRCRRHGIQGSPVDFLICAAASHAGVPILTLDKDFHLFRPHLKIKLHPIRGRSH